MLSGDDAHHAARVLRVRRGETISVADGTGRVMDAVVTNVGPTVDAEIHATRQTARSVPSIRLYQGVGKGDRMDLVVQKSVEIGVARVVPVLMERSIVRWEERRSARARDRWREIARAAAKQSRSPWLTEVSDVADGIGIMDEDLRVALDPDAPSRLRDVLPASLGLVVGPEGGLAPGELERLRAQGAATAALGDRILRTETAGPVAAAQVLYAYGSLG